MRLLNYDIYLMCQEECYIKLKDTTFWERYVRAGTEVTEPMKLE